MFIVHFVEYLKDLLEKLSICNENKSKFVHSEFWKRKKNVFNCVYLQCSRGVTGIRRSSLLLLLSVLRSVMLLLYCFASQRLEMIIANIYMAYI